MTGKVIVFFEDEDLKSPNDVKSQCVFKSVYLYMKHIEKWCRLDNVVQYSSLV